MIAGMPTTARASAVSRRLRIGVLEFARGGLSISTLALREGLQGPGVFLFGEVGPEGRRDIPLRVRGLPDQEVADAQLARGPDDQVRIGDADSVEIPANKLVAYLSWGYTVPHHSLNGLHDLIPATVVKGDV